MPPAMRPGGPQPQGGTQKLTTNDALSYLREVKNRFADRKDVYDTFLEIMKEFKAQRIDTAGVIVRVKQLFKGHRELILGFNTFLPRGYEIELARQSDDEEEEEEHAAGGKQPVEFDQAINYVNKIKMRFSGDERVYKAFLEILNMYRKGQKTITDVYDEVAVLFRQHQDLLDEFTYFLPDNSAASYNRSRQGGAMRGPGGGPMGRGPPRAVGMGGGGGGGGGGGSPVDHTRLMHKRKAARKAEEGFRRMEHEDDPYGAAARGGGAAGGGRPLARELGFLERVKQRLRNREQYSDFLKVLNLFSQEIISRQELVQLVADMFNRAPDLMQQFHQFVAGCENIDPADLNSASYGRPLPAATTRDMLKQKLQKDKYMTKPLSEIVAMETERITPSYVKMPPGYPKLAQSGRNALGDEVLNDQYVNVITGSEDYSFKLMRKNQYEEALFRCEDDRYEFEMACEQNASAIRALQPFVERLSSLPPEERPHMRLTDIRGLSPVHMGHIQRLYGEQGSVLIDLLGKNPAVAVPIVLSRLIAKEAEWKKVKEEMTRVWRKIYEQNYPRSLDHRSFYFKQQEKKNMMAKAMVSEVKEAADRRRGTWSHLACVSMALRYAAPAAPAADGTADLTFTYSDRSVFEDAYVVLCAAMEHGLNSSSRDAVHLLYLQSIEPFFGVPERTAELERLRAEADQDRDKDTDVEMGDTKSSSSEQEGAAAGGGGLDDGVTGGRNGKTPTPAPDRTPEPGDDKPQPSGAETGVTGNNDERGEENQSGDRRSRRGGAALESEREEHMYAGCKPIMPWLGPAQSENSNASTSTSLPVNRHYVAPQGTRLLFANESLYLFFRYHRYLYERLSLARRFCTEIATKKLTAASRPPLPSLALPVAGGPPTSAQLVAESAEAGRSTAPDPAQEAAIKEEADRLHASFIQTVIDNLGQHSHAQDQGAFEDAIRSLLGTNSYELFTLDKLLSKLVKHMQLMVQDDSSSKLWELFRYESARGTRICAAMYHINAHTVMEDACYRVEFRDGDCTLRFQMNDPEKPDPHAVVEGAPTEYVAGYVSGGPTPSNLLPQSSHEMSCLYLRRNLPPSAKAGGTSPGGPVSDEALVGALELVLIRNGLECKIACATDKVSYVLDTEDLMVRRKRRRPHQGEGSSAAAAAAKRARFEKWLASAGKPSAAAHPAAGAADGPQGEAAGGQQALEQLEAAALGALGAMS